MGIALQWSEPTPPNSECAYDHVVAETPLGQIRLEWKSWKESSSPCGHMPWGEFVVGVDLEDAKLKAQEAWGRKVAEIAP